MLKDENKASKTTFTKHEDVVQYIWSIDRAMLNHIFYIDTQLYRKYSRYSKNSVPELVKFCDDYNLSLGYVLHENKHPVTMNYYNSASDCEDSSDDEFENIDEDLVPLLHEGHTSSSN